MMNPSKQEMQCCLNQCDKSGRFGTPGWFKLFLCGRKVALVSALERDASGPSRGVWRVPLALGCALVRLHYAGTTGAGLGAPSSSGRSDVEGAPRVAAPRS
jgi:hypothetical protein